MPQPFDRIGPHDDRDTIIDALAKALHGKRESAGAWEDWRESARSRLEAAFAAVDNGHTVVWDPPAALTSVRCRWTVSTGRRSTARAR